MTWQWVALVLILALELELLLLGWALWVTLPTRRAELTRQAAVKALDEQARAADAPTKADAWPAHR
jgi:hypothetical protein